MKKLSALLLALSVPAALKAAPQTLESLSVSAEQGFFAVPAFTPMKAAPDVSQLFANPVIKPAQTLGPEVGRVSLPGQLDRHRSLLSMQLGPTTWNVSVAGDAAFKKYFLTFQQGERLVIAPLGDVNRLRNEGVDVTIEPGVSYHFHVSINIFNPIRGSTLEITHNDPTNGQDYNISTGDLLDAIKSKSYVFSAGDNEYWMLYGTDVDPATNALTNTHSLLFFHEAGMSSKGWPMAESSVPVGQATNVAFGDQSLALEHTADGLLIIHGQ